MARNLSLSHITLTKKKLISFFYDFWFISESFAFDRNFEALYFLRGYSLTIRLDNLFETIL